jgi:hypothetical protein
VELTTYTDQEFVSETFPVDPLLGSDLLDAGEKLLIVGESESGKSYLALQLALELARGGEWLGYSVTRPCTVSILQSEMSIGRYHQRYMKLRNNYKVRNLGIHITTTESLKLDKPEGSDLFSQHVLDCEPDVIIFDPVRAFYSGDENASHAVEAWFESIAQAQTERPFSPVMVHHARKQSRGYSREVGTKALARGSGLFTDRPSTVINLDVNENQTAWTMYVTKARNRDRRPEPVDLVANFTTGLFEVVIPSLPERVQELLESIGEGRRQAEVVQEVATSREVSERAVELWITKAVEDELITREQLKRESGNPYFLRRI